MHILELCSGWCSVSRVFEQDHGWHTATLDNRCKFKPTILTDITMWDYRDYFATHPLPDVIWASPACRTMSVAAWSQHRGGDGAAISRQSEEGDKCVQACLRIIEHCLSLNASLIYFSARTLCMAHFAGCPVCNRTCNEVTTVCCSMATMLTHTP